MAESSFAAQEIADQPRCWREAAAVAVEHRDLLPRAGERVAVVGCGTSWFMAMAYARLREAAGHGETDAFAASEAPAGRRYDRIVALTRSGTTTEVLDALRGRRGTAPTVALTADPGTPVTGHADATIALPFADERSVVQTRFATTALALLRCSLGEDLAPLAAQAEAALAVELPVPADTEQFAFLGRGWTVGIAQEAALKLREAATAWTEAYPAMEYRHGPISIAQPGRVTWMFGAPPEGLAEQVARTGATFLTSGELDPMAHLVLAQRVALAAARARGLDPDNPRGLTRSVVLESP